MLNELPKKPKKPVNAWGRFWRTQWHCLSRSVTIFVMYLISGLLGLIVQSLSYEGTEIYEIVLGCVCIVLGMVLNAPLAFNYGKEAYDFYLTGCLHRKNAAYGIQTGSDHRTEKEFRWWKGFLIGAYSGLPLVIAGIFAALPATWSMGETVLLFVASWAILPIQWIRLSLFPEWQADTYPAISGGYAIIMIILPILVTGIGYLLGAYTEKVRKQLEKERAERILEAGKKISEEQKGKK